MEFCNTDNILVILNKAGTHYRYGGVLNAAILFLSKNFYLQFTE